MTLRKLFTYSVIWRILLFIIPLIVIHPADIFSVWGHFDGQRFINLAREGYGTPSTFENYSLFPFYPHLIRSLSIFGSYFTAGFLISNLSLAISVLVFWKLLRLDLKPQTAFFACVLVAIFPSSYILGALYSESLFLLLSLTSFYLARKNKFVYAAIFAFFACYTRAAGIFVWISLVIEYFSQKEINKKTLLNPSFFSLILPPIGSIIYLKFLSVYTSNVLDFLPSIPNKLVLLHQVFIRYGKMVVFIDHSSTLFLVVLTELLVGLLGLLVIIFSHKYLRVSYWSYILFSYLVPTLWGNFVGMPRFLLVCFPIFIFIAYLLEKSHPYYKYLYVAISSTLALSNLLLFAQNIFTG